MQRNIRKKKSAEKRTVLWSEPDLLEGGDPKYKQVCLEGSLHSEVPCIMAIWDPPRQTDRQRQTDGTENRR